MAEVINAIKEIRKDDIIIAFMGPAGTGKSHFIDLLTGQQGQRAGDSLKATTNQIQATRVKHPKYSDRIVLVDTPGFDDTTKSVNMISDWLVKTYEKSVPLSGLIYLHRITDNRMAGSPYGNLRMFEKLCGDAAMNQVILTSTMWQKVDRAIGEAREKELLSKFWKTLIDKGSKVKRLMKNTRESAWDIVNQLIKGKEERQPVLLRQDLDKVRIDLSKIPKGQELYELLGKMLEDQRKALELSSALLGGSSDPWIMEELQTVFTAAMKGFEDIFRNIMKLGIQLGQWIIACFFGTKTRAETVKVRGEAVV